ncbi:mannose-P-dolichol utilization defect 1 protein-like [Neosynchiropus ocellatus]
MASSSLKHFLVLYLMPEKCYEKLVVNFHFHAPCLIFVLRKVFAFWILLDALFAQLAQLLKVLWTGSAEGLSLTAVLLQLYAFSCPVLYGVASNFPVIAWGERLVVVCQTALMVFLILHFRGRALSGILFLLAFSGSMFLLGSLATTELLSVLQASTSAAVVLSKAFQVAANHSNGHTGQLSTTSVLLTWVASLGQAFISMQDTGFSLTTLTFTLSACLSCVLLAQVLSTSPKLKRD